MAPQEEDVQEVIDQVAGRIALCGIAVAVVAGGEGVRVDLVDIARRRIPKSRR